MAHHHHPHRPTHQLNTIEFKLHLPSPTTPAITGYAFGHSDTYRGSLWAESNIWQDEEDFPNAPADWIHHLALCAVQDRPNTMERLLFSLTGGLGYQDPLF